jgi:hypothetical protein
MWHRIKVEGGIRGLVEWDRIMGERRGRRRVEWGRVRLE